jgi:hypothetical protein
MLVAWSSGAMRVDVDEKGSVFLCGGSESNVRNEDYGADKSTVMVTVTWLLQQQARWVHKFQDSPTNIKNPLLA